MEEVSARFPFKQALHRLWCAAPMLRVALALMAGIVLAEYCPVVSPRAWAIAAGAGWILLMLSLSVRRLRKDILYLPALWVVMMAEGALLAQHRPPDELTAEWQLMQVRLCDTPRQTPKCYKMDVAVEAVCDSVGWRSASSRMILYLRQDDAAAALRYGDRVVVRGKPERPSESVGADGFNYRRYLLRKGIYWQCFSDSTGWRLVAGADGFSLKRWSKEVQLSLVQRIRGCRLTAAQQGIAEALLLGWKADVDEQVQQQFRAAGITHLLCVSGLHVGIVAWLAGLLFAGWAWRRWQRMLKGAVQIAVVWLFVAVTGMAPSTLRAGVMFSLLIVGYMLGRKGYLLNNLSTSAVLLLCVRPGVLFDVGFQLSYAAVLGIAAWCRPLEQLIWFPGNWWWQLMRRLWDLICLSVSAQMATLPFTLYYFHQFPTYFLVANILIVPFAGLLLGTVMVMVLTTGWVWLCDCVTVALRWELAAADAIICWVGSLPCAMLEDIYFDLPRALLTVVLQLCLTVVLRCKL